MKKISKKQIIEKINLMDQITEFNVNEKENQEIDIFISGKYKQEKKGDKDKMTKKEFDEGMVELKELLSIGLNNMNQKIDNFKKDIDTRFNEMDNKIENIKKDIDNKIENVKKDIDTRFNEMDNKIENVKKDIDTRFDVIDQRLDKVETRLDKIEHDVNQIKNTATMKKELKI